MWAIIAGSGFEDLCDNLEILESPSLNTPFGTASPGLKRVRLLGHECLFIPRHGAQHELMPHEINYRANIFVLKRLGAKKCLALSSVSSLTEECQLGSVVLPTQFLNLKRENRTPVSFCGNGIVGHVSLANPIWSSAYECLKQQSSRLPFALHIDKTYVCIDGPTYATKAEARWYHSLNGHISGMTAYPEYALAREAGICFLPCCFVVRYDQWDGEESPPAPWEDLGSLLEHNKTKALQVIKTLFEHPPEEDLHCRKGGLSQALLTPWEEIDSAHRVWIETLLH